ncbi:pyridoxamine 5'-phosphate oxidase [Streptomyces sp. LP11]|uniref:Pyridoxamine 5'-phosphate oxidase n=1 Tax=Streptomyces pyxinicus TaxID=2970331 RepID=A0ABT2AVX8_9ACTN|nr:pyridoxamine 5'-phosphate oxidase [Streptomyces sp. LP11]MCS0600396.1 pyridoxamine 5'-phosphate oxidase [Streptomyces sp. LP11]
MTGIDAALGATIDAYRTCEFTTLGTAGTPLTWPTAAWRRPDGTFLVTTCLAFAQKAFNVRRDDRVALLFSDPTGSGDSDAPQVFVSGTASCPEEIRTAPDEAAEYWRRMFQRQPHSRPFVSAPGKWFMDWYYLRLFITITPERVEVRPPLSQLRPAEPGSVPAPGLPGAALVARYPSAVLGTRDTYRSPLLTRVRPRVTPDGFAVPRAALGDAAPGRASLLVHRHDERLNGMHNALITGELVGTDDDHWTLLPRKVTEPAGSGRPRDAYRTLRTARRATARYLRDHELTRPRVDWAAYRALAEEGATSRGGSRPS